MDKPATPLLSGKIKTLDGIRGLAILMVCCYHYLQRFSFGWTGVELFFVLSGFLITGKLVESLGSPHYFRSFYTKRLLRIIPLYYFVLLVFFVLVPVLLPFFVSSSFKELLQHQVVYWTFTVNVRDALQGWPVNITLIHFWSLACEMQFYLLWPFVVYFFYRNSSSFKIVLIVFFLGGMLFRIYGSAFFQMNWVYRYVLLPCRMDAFCAGAFIYLLTSRGEIERYKRLFMIIALAVLCAVLAIMVIAETPWHFSAAVVSSYGYSLDAIFWAAIIGLVLSAVPTSGIRIFSGRPLTTLGKYSYGIYVFHLPVLIVLSSQFLLNIQKNEKTISLAFAAFVISCLCSFASYHLFEKYFLKLKPAA